MIAQTAILFAAAVTTGVIVTLGSVDIFEWVWDRSDWPLRPLGWYPVLLPATTAILGLGSLVTCVQSVRRNEPDRLIDAAPYVAVVAAAIVGWAMSVFVTVTYAVSAAFAASAAVASVAVYMKARAWRNGRSVVVIDAFASSLVATTAIGATLCSVAAVQNMPTQILDSNVVVDISIHAPVALITALVVIHSHDPLLPLLAAAGIAAFEAWKVLIFAAPAHGILAAYAAVKRIG
jgi:hypothetical protein